MNKHFLKNIRDNIPEPVKYITAPVFRYKLLNDKNFQKYYKLLENSLNFTEEKIKEYQLEQLKNILGYSYKYVPYYTNLFNQIGFDINRVTSFDDINGIPFLTKSMIRANFEQLTSKEKGGTGYYTATTGASTGEPLKVLLDYDSIFKESAFIYFFRKRLGYKFEDKLATFRGVEFGDKLWMYNPMHNELVFSPFKLSRLTIAKYLEKIIKYKPQYLNGYHSCLYLFAKLLHDNNLKFDIKLKGIFLMSENVDITQRNFLEEFFGVKTQQHYGHSERCVLAQEEVKGLYKISPFYGYTELIAQPNGNEIVSTGFLNKIMPLIRYKTGDFCKKDNHLIAIQGRWNIDEYLLGMNNEKIFYSSFHFQSDIFQHVTNYQFYQKQKGKSELLLIVNKNFNQGEIELMRKEIDKKLKGIIDVEIKVVDTLLLSPRGKFKRFYLSIND